MTKIYELEIREEYITDPGEVVASSNSLHEIEKLREDYLLKYPDSIAIILIGESI